MVARDRDDVLLGLLARQLAGEVVAHVLVEERTALSLRAGSDDEQGEERVYEVVHLRVEIASMHWNSAP